MILVDSIQYYVTFMTMNKSHSKIWGYSKVFCCCKSKEAFFYLNYGQFRFDCILLFTIIEFCLNWIHLIKFHFKEVRKERLYKIDFSTQLCELVDNLKHLLMHYLLDWPSVLRFWNTKYCTPRISSFAKVFVKRQNFFIAILWLSLKLKVFELCWILGDLLKYYDILKILEDLCFCLWIWFFFLF